MKGKESVVSRTLEHFNYLHQIPELGFEEYKTSAYIGDALAAAGFPGSPQRWRDYRDCRRNR